MKKFSLALSFAALLTGAMFLTTSSCTKDKCKDIICQNGGTCVDGTCQCPSGFTGQFCETAVAAPNAKYIGTWNVDACNNAPDYSTTTVVGATSSEFIIKKFHGDPQYDVKATVSSPNTNNFTIAIQSMSTGMKFQGSGTLNSAGTVMTVSYDLLDGQDVVQQSCVNVPYTK